LTSFRLNPNSLVVWWNNIFDMRQEYHYGRPKVRLTMVVSYVLTIQTLPINTKWLSYLLSTYIVTIISADQLKHDTFPSKFSNIYIYLELTHIKPRIRVLSRL
jgi:hypothetical protein